MKLPATTGDAALDFAIDAGPRAITPDTPEHLLREIGKYKCFAGLREVLKRRKLARRVELLSIIERTCIENRLLEEIYQGTSSFLPEARIPIDVVHELEAENKQPWNPEMREDTLKCYPGLRLNIRRGSKGQQYLQTTERTEDHGRSS